jgi:NlpC/P60 family putative phage cell wall peptidase
LSFNRAHIVDTARGWLGTPYHHQAYLKHIGADCLGLLRGMYIELYGTDPEKPPTYSESWGEANPDELLLKAASSHLIAAPYEGWLPGDVLVFRVKNAASAKHCAIALGADQMIHAVSNRCVMQTTIGAWGGRVAGVFMFPGVQ